jgi:hypothetical protein
VVNLETTVRGLVTNFDQQVGRTLTLEGGSVAGVSNQVGTFIVQTDAQSRIVSGSDFLVGGPTSVLDGSLLIENGAVVRGGNAVVVSEGANLIVDGELRKSINVEEGAVLQGTGQLEGSLIMAGMLSPGSSAGTLKAKGEINLTNTATVCIEIGGTVAGSGGFDVLDGSETSNIYLGESSLELTLINGFLPDPSDEFVFLQSFNSISGIFGNLGDGFGDGERIHFSGGSFELNVGTSSIFLSDFQAIPEPCSVLLVLGSGCVLSSKRRRLRKFGNPVGNWRSQLSARSELCR